MGLNSNHHIRCLRQNCGFVVHDRYFADKPRFTPGICPACGGNLHVVDPFTETKSTTHRLGVDPSVSREYGHVVPILTPA